MEVVIITVVIKAKGNSAWRTLNIPTAWQGPEADGLRSASEALWVCEHALPNSPAGPGEVPHACVPGIGSRLTSDPGR